MGGAFGNRVQFGEGQSLVARDDRFVVGMKRAESAEQSRQSRGKVGDDRLAPLVLADDERFRPGRMTSASASS